jgi:hypothetical protein
MNSKSIAIIAASIVAGSIGVFMIYSIAAAPDIKPVITKTEPDEVQNVKRGFKTYVTFTYTNMGPNPVDSLHISMYAPAGLNIHTLRFSDPTPSNNTITYNPSIRSDFYIKYKEGSSIKELRGNKLDKASFSANEGSFVFYELTTNMNIGVGDSVSVAVRFSTGTFTKEINDVYITANESNYFYRVILQ